MKLVSMCWGPSRTQGAPRASCPLAEGGGSEKRGGNS